MAQPSSFNVTEALKQLGLKDVTELPILRGIQPTISLGDGGALVSPLTPPIAWAGGTAVGNTVDTYPALVVQSLGPGGCFCRSTGVCSTANGQVRWRIGAASLAVTTTAACPLSQMGPTDVLSVVSRITTVDTIAVDQPNVAALASTAVHIPDLVFIPRGMVLEVWVQSLTAVASFSVCVQDVPSPALSPNG